MPRPFAALALLVTTLGLPRPVAAQDGSELTVFPSDIVGFRFGADLAEVESVCAEGERIGHLYRCTRPADPLNFPSVIEVTLDAGERVSGVRISAEGARTPRQLASLHEGLYQQLLDLMGRPVAADFSFGGHIVHVWSAAERYRRCTVALTFTRYSDGTAALLLDFDVAHVP